MEYVFEFLLELLLEGSIEASKSKKVPKPLRYFLIGFILLFFAGVIFLVIFAGFMVVDENFLLGATFIAIGVFMAVAGILRFHKDYVTKSKVLERKNKRDREN